MKRLLVLLILLLAVPTWAQQCSEDTQVAKLGSHMLGSVPAAAGSVPNLISERFNNAFDVSWDTQEGSSFETTVPTSRTTSTHSRKFPLDASNDECLENFGSNSSVYFHFWLRVTSGTAWDDEDYVYVFMMYDDGGSNMVMDIKVDYETDVTSYRMVARYYDGANTACASNPSISLDTWYEIKGHYIIGGTTDWVDMQWRADGGTWASMCNDDSPAGARANVSIFNIGSVGTISGIPAGAYILFDSVSVDSAQDLTIED